MGERMEQICLVTPPSNRALLPDNTSLSVIYGLKISHTLTTVVIYVQNWERHLMLTTITKQLMYVGNGRHRPNSSYIEHRLSCNILQKHLLTNQLWIFMQLALSLTNNCSSGSICSIHFFEQHTFEMPTIWSCDFSHDCHTSTTSGWPEMC